MKTAQEKELITYIGTQRGSTSPVKLDALLEERIRAFKRAKQIRRFSFLK